MGDADSLKLWPPTVTLAGLVALGLLALIVRWSAAPLVRPAEPRVTLRGAVRINQAPPATLTLLPGIGPAIAKHVVTARRTQGPFKKKTDLQKAHGIGPVRQRRMAPWVIFTPAHKTNPAGDGIRVTVTQPPEH